MLRVFVLVVLTVALQPRFHASVEPIGPGVRADLRDVAMDPGCPTSPASLRLLTVSYWGFDRRPHTGGLVVGARYAAPLANVFHRLWQIRFPIRHMRYADAYRRTPHDNDVSVSFDCTKAVPDPCGGGSGSWSEHAYGAAVDLNPIENPYVCGGRVHDPASRPFMDRSRLRRGMITPEVVRAFRSIGWGWGGSWAGPVKDYTHFSASGH